MSAKLGATGEMSNVQSDSVYGFIWRGNPYAGAYSTLRGVSGVFHSISDWLQSLP